jgi:endonuclease YncB( thermonuclease family)
MPRISKPKLILYVMFGGLLILAGVVSILKHANYPVIESARGLVGRASVIDGDTIEIHGQRIRLAGIDAPESAQLCEANGRNYRCGQQASFALANFIASHTVACERTGTDRYRRVLARCTTNGTDINRWMVSQGWAIAYRRYSTEYTDSEEDARRSKLGIWAGSFTEPEQWRHRNSGR